MCAHMLVCIFLWSLTSCEITTGNPPFGGGGSVIRVGSCMDLFAKSCLVMTLVNVSIVPDDLFLKGILTPWSVANGVPSFGKSSRLIAC